MRRDLLIIGVAVAIGLVLPYLRSGVLKVYDRLRNRRRARVAYPTAVPQTKCNAQRYIFADDYEIDLHPCAGHKLLSDAEAQLLHPDSQLVHVKGVTH